MIMRKLIFALIVMGELVAIGGDVDDIAATIWDEARGESFEGRQHIASVIWNRGNGNASEMAKAVKKPKQFSGWNGGKRPAVKIANAKDEEIWNECKAFAKAMANGTFNPVTNATHYHNDNVSPKWRLKLTYLKKVGHHLFYV